MVKITLKKFWKYETSVVYWITKSKCEISGRAVKKLNNIRTSLGQTDGDMLFVPVK